MIIFPYGQKNGLELQVFFLFNVFFKIQIFFVTLILFTYHDIVTEIKQFLNDEYKEKLKRRSKGFIIYCGHNSLASKGCYCLRYFCICLHFRGMRFRGLAIRGLCFRFSRHPSKAELSRGPFPCFSIVACKADENNRRLFY